MSEIKEIHVVPNTHWDREFRESFEKTRDHLVEMMDVTIETMVKDPEYKYYTLDAHCILLDDYLQVRPEMTETVTKLVKERRLLIGPWYTLPDSPNIGAEALARNFLWARKFADRFGVEVMREGYTPCNWGQPSQLPQIFHQIGVGSALIYRGISPHECPAEWIWVAPDGSEIIGHRFGLFARYNWYYFVFRPVTYGVDPYDKSYRLGDFGEATFRLANAEEGEQNLANFRVLNPDPRAFREEELMPALEKILEMEANEFTAPYFLAMHGHDVSVAHPMDPKAVAVLNAKQGKFKLEMSNLEVYMEKLRAWMKGRDDLVRLEGERRGNLKRGFWTYLLPATISARTYLKVDNAVTERMLTLQAEPFAVMGMLHGRAYPEHQLERAWRYLLDCHTHDAIAGCAPDVVCEDIEFRFRQTRDLSEVVMDRSMQQVARQLNLPDAEEDAVYLVAFNTLPYERSEKVQFEVAFPADMKPQGLRLETMDGQEVPYQLVSVKADSFFVDSIWEVPKNTAVVKFTVIAQVDSVPGLGYTVLRAKPLAKPSRTHGTLSSEPNVLENRLIRVEVQGNGTFNLIDKTTGQTYHGLNYFLDQGVAGNAWKHESPERDVRQNSLGCQARIATVKDGALEAAIEVQLSLELPVDLENREDPHGRTVQVPIKSVYTIKRDDPVVYVSTTVNNTAKDHWLRAIFPSGIDTDVVHADTHFDLVERDIPLPDCSDWVEDVSGTTFMNNFVSLEENTCGLAVMSEGLLEYEVFDKPDRPIALTLLRAMWIKLEVSEEKKQVLPDLGMQCPGEQTFRYAVQPHHGDCVEAQTHRVSQRHRVPVEMAQVGHARGPLPLQESLVDIGDSKVVITSIKKAEDSGRIVVRGFNLKEEPTMLRLRTGFPLADAVSYALHERGEEAIPHNEDGLEMAIPKKRIFTLGLGVKNQ